MFFYVQQANRDLTKILHTCKKFSDILKMVISTLHVPLYTVLFALKSFQLVHSDPLSICPEIVYSYWIMRPLEEEYILELDTGV